VFGFTPEQVIENLKLQLATAWWVMRWPMFVVCLGVGLFWLWDVWQEHLAHEKELKGNYKFRE